MGWFGCCSGHGEMGQRPVGFPLPPQDAKSGCVSQILASGQVFQELDGCSVMSKSSYLVCSEICKVGML